MSFSELQFLAKC